MIDYNFENTVELKLDFDAISAWIEKIVSREILELGELTYIFCDDETILEVNQKFLNHDYYTDVITFDYTEENIISGDIYISLDTVKSNSELYNTTFLEELYRVIIHGVLHLCGYKDKSDKDEKLMRQKEDEALKMLYL